MLKNYKYYLENLSCPNCAKKIEDTLDKDNRFTDVSLNFNLLTLAFKSNLDNPYNEISKIIKNIEPEVNVKVEDKKEIKINYDLYLLIISLVLLLILVFINNSIIKNIFIIIVYAILLYKPVTKAIKIFFKTKRIDENLLISISAIGAYLLDNHLEGIMVVLLYDIGKLLENMALNKSRGEIKGLLDLKINSANLLEGKNIKKVDVSTLKSGDVIIVKKGELVPVDGVVIKGNTELDTSSLTGEQIPLKVAKNSKVLSGSINMGDVINIKVTSPYKESMAYKIFELSMNATNNKSETETRVSVIAKYYTPIVLGISIIIATFLPLISNITYNDSIYRALTFLVISCPCAIAISVPLSYFACIGKYSSKKVLVKGSNFLDILLKCKTIIFDKTGTLTKGSFKIEKINIFAENYREKDILEIIALGESFSNHPIAKVILNEYSGKLDLNKVKDFTEVAGLGITYKIGNKNIKVGNKTLVKTTKTGNIFLSINDKIVASIIFNDMIKENAKFVIDELHKQNMQVVMLTGDNEYYAKMIQEKIKIDEYQAGLLPHQKYEELDKYQNEGKIIFVGDGINDTPSLVKADVGISMGQIGSNSAIEYSDIVIMNDNLEGILKVRKIAKKTSDIITMNLLFAILVKIIILLLGTLGYASMWAAVFADTGVTLLTILNSLRILK